MKTNRSVWIGLATAFVVSFGSAALAAADEQPATGLIDVVLGATERFRDPAAAIAAEYAPANACVTGPQEGAMGEHFIKGSILFDGQIDPQQPEALIYEHHNGKARLVGVEYIVIADAWHANNAATPAVMGQLMNYVGSPNRYGLPAFYELHVWAWRFNPNGAFVDWNPKVSCADFVPAPPSVSALQGHVHGEDARVAGTVQNTAASRRNAR